MGCCVSTQSAINVDSEEPSFETLRATQPKAKCMKILLLGTSNSGKTTIIKQLQKICDFYKQDSYRNISTFIKDSIIINMKMLCIQSLHDENLDNFRKDILALKQPYNLSADIVYKIKALYKDCEIEERLKALTKTDCFQNYGNIDYFIDKIDEISSNEYIADFEDSVRIYRRTIGYSVTKLLRFVDVFDEYIFEICDVGGTQSERKKWRNKKLLLHPNLNTIIYVVAISEYDINNKTTNRLIESINVFKEILESIKNLKNKSIILLFNKYDLFQEKITRIPITVTFDNFPKNMLPNDADHVIRFIAAQFFNVFQEFDIALNKALHIVRTVGIDTHSINIMFNKITPEIVADFEENTKNMDDDNDDPLMLPQNQYSLPIHVMHKQHLEKPLKLQLANSLPIAI